MIIFYYNKMIVSNDLFRDHINKCYIDMKLIIPYSKCIQVINSNIYIPTNTGFYLIQDFI